MLNETVTSGAGSIELMRRQTFYILTVALPSMIFQLESKQAPKLTNI